MNDNQAKYLLYLILLLTTACIVPLSHLSFSTNIELLLPEKDRYVKFYKSFRNAFHTDLDDETILIGLENSKGIFQQDFLDKTAKLTKFLTGLKSIEKVYSLTSSSFIFFKDNQFNARPVIHISQPELYKQDSIGLFESKEFRDMLIDQDGKSIAIAALNSPNLGRKQKEQLITSINSKLSELKFEKAHVAGKVPLEIAVTNELLHESVMNLVLFVLFGGLVLYYLYRSLKLLIVIALVIIVPNIWIFSLISLFGYSLDLNTLLIFPVLFTTAIFSCINFINDFKAAKTVRLNMLEAVNLSLQRSDINGILSSIIIAIAFFSLCFFNIQALTTLGIFAGLGVLLTHAFSLLVLAIYFRSISYQDNDKSNAFNHFETGLISKVFVNSLRYKSGISLMVMILVGISIYLIPSLDFKSKLNDVVPESNLPDYKYVEDKFYGLRSFEMVLHSNKPADSFLAKEMLNKADSIENYLKDSLGVGHLISAISLYKGANKAYKGGNNSYFILPESQHELNTYTQNIMQTQYVDEMKRFMLEDGSKMRLSGKLKEIDADRFNLLESQFDKYFKSKGFDKHFNYQMTGPNYLVDKFKYYYLKSTVICLLIGVMLVCLLGFFLLNSGRMFFISFLIPTSSIIIAAGIAAISGINLNPLISLSFLISMSIGAYYTINFIEHFKKESSKSNPFIMTLKHSYFNSTKSLITISLILLISFMIFVFSGFQSLKLIGFLLSLNLIITMIMTLTIMPIAMLLLQRKYGVSVN